MDSNTLSRFAVPGVVTVITYLAYGSQWLFRYIEPYALDEVIEFNVLVGCVWICYFRACFTNPGNVPLNWKPNQANGPPAIYPEVVLATKPRWCRKCETLKPPRAHHCKQCGRCIPKMDHHCPWTKNCVSYHTFPHFCRFLLYSVIAMAFLESLLYTRFAIIWRTRHLPSYMGPSPLQLILLLVYILTNSLALFALSMLLVRTIWSLGANVTAIEGWEIERHRNLVRRARSDGGYLNGPQGVRVRIRKQEFPYDVGIWRNITQGMGGNPLTWLWPLARTPSAMHGLQFETNGFEDPLTSWPPPDPDRIPRQVRDMGPPFTHGELPESCEDQLDSFRQRQEQDLKRFLPSGTTTQQKPFNARRYHLSEDKTEASCASDYDIQSHGKERWLNSEGERLADYGVDEMAEFYDEDDIPLGTLLNRRRQPNARQNILGNY